MNQKVRLKEMLNDDRNKNSLVGELLDEVGSDAANVSISGDTISAQKLNAVWADRIQNSKRDPSLWVSRSFDRILRQGDQLAVAVIDVMDYRRVLFMTVDNEVVYAAKFYPLESD